jgi:hypothetical protein
MAEIKPKEKMVVIVTILVVITMIIILLIASWILTRGVEDETVPTAPSATESNGSPPAPTNPGSTGGTSGGGNETPNDPSAGTPSPAGGVDTNGATQ